MQTDYELAIRELAALQISPQSKTPEPPESHEPSKFTDYECLISLSMVDQSATLLDGFSFTACATNELRANISSFLNETRKDGYNVRSVLSACMKQLATVRSRPLLVGEEIIGILGWDFLSQQYLQLIHQKDPTSRLDDCLSQETINHVQADCKKTPSNITIRIPVKPGSEDRIEALHRTLKAIPKTCISELSKAAFFSFQYDTVRFEFPHNEPNYYDTSSKSLQIDLTDTLEPIISDNKNGNQWCVDTMLKLIRTYCDSDETTQSLFRHVKNGYDPRGQAHLHIKKRLGALKVFDLFSFWQECGGTTEEQKAQNALILYQLCSNFELDESERLTLEESLPLFITNAFGSIDPKISLWHACLSLLQQKALSFSELESLLQLYGIACCKIQPEGIFQFSCFAPTGSSSLCIRSSECLFLIPLNLSRAVTHFVALHERIGNDKGIEALVDHIQDDIGTKHTSFTMPQVPDVMSTEATYIPELLLSSVSADCASFNDALYNLTSHIRSSRPSIRHMMGAALKIALRAKGFIVSEQLQNGALQSKELETRWIDYLLGLSAPGLVDIGKKLLLELPKHTNFKCQHVRQFIESDPDTALRIIQQIESEPSVDEATVSSWLKNASTNKQVRIWEYLASRPSGRWALLCLNPDFTFEQIQRALSILEERQEPLSKNSRSFLEKQFTAFVAYAKENQRFDLAVRFMKVYHALSSSGLTKDQIEELTLLAQQPLPEDLAAWYLTVGNKSTPVAQLRAIVQISANHPGCVAKLNASSIASLCGRIDEQQKQPLRQAIKALPANCQGPFAALFSAKRDKKAQVPQAVMGPIETLIAKSQWCEAAAQLLKDELTNKDLAESCIEGLLSLHHPDPEDQVFTLLSRYPSIPAKQWIRSFKAFEEKLDSDKIHSGICTLLQCKDTIGPIELRALWLYILANTQWLSTEKTINIFLEIDFFKTLFLEEFTSPKEAQKNQDNLASAIKQLITLLKTAKGNWISLAYQWYELLPTNHKDKATIGLSLVQYCNNDVLLSACKIVDIIAPKLAQLDKLYPPAKPNQPRPTFLALVRFCITARAAQANKDTHSTVLGLVKALGSLEAPEAYRRAVATFCDHTEQSIIEALWPSVKKLLPLMKDTSEETAPLRVSIAKTLRTLLQTATLPTVIEIMQTHYNCEKLLLEEAASTVEFVQHPKIKADKDLTQAFDRLLTLVLNSESNLDARKAIAIDMKIARCYPQQAEDIEKAVTDLQRKRAKLFFRQLLHQGWSTVTKEIFAHLLSTRNEHAQSREFLTLADDVRFYSHARKSNAKSNREIGSICPRSPDNLEQTYIFIDEAFLIIREKQAKSECVDLLLDFVLQSIRNSMEKRANASFLYDCIERLAQSCPPSDAQHCLLITALVKTAIRKDLLKRESTEVKAIFAKINRNVEELDIEDEEPLKELEQTLSNCTDANRAEQISKAEKQLLVWQELHFVSSYERRQSYLKGIFALRVQSAPKAFDKTAQNQTISLLMPNSVLFGINDNNTGRRAALDSLEAYLDCHINLYLQIVRKNPKGAYDEGSKPKAWGLLLTHSTQGNLAYNYLQKIVMDFSCAHENDVYQENYDKFIEQARKIMRMWKEVPYFEILSIQVIASSFTTCLLKSTTVADDKPKRAALVWEWLQLVKECKNIDNQLLINNLNMEIAKSNCLELYSEERQLDLIKSLTEDSKTDVIMTWASRIAKSTVVPEYLPDFIYLLFRNWLATPTNDKALPITYLKTLILALRKSLEHQQYDYLSNEFLKYSSKILVNFEKTSCLSLTDLGEPITAFSNLILCEVSRDQEHRRALLGCELLKVLSKYKGDRLYGTLINTIVIRMIETQAIKTFCLLTETDRTVLLRCLEDIKSLGIQREQKVENALILQMAAGRAEANLKEFEQLSQKVLEESE